MIYSTKNKQIVLARTGDLMVMAVAPVTIDDETWADSIDRFVDFHTNEPVSLFINYAPTHVPTTRQRDMLAKAWVDYPQLMNAKSGALLTDSLLVRGAVTAMNWLSRGGLETRSFKTNQHDEAISWLNQRGNFDEHQASLLLATLVAHTGGRLP